MASIHEDNLPFKIKDALADAYPDVKPGNLIVQIYEALDADQQRNAAYRGIAMLAATYADPGWESDPVVIEAKKIGAAKVEAKRAEWKQLTKFEKTVEVNGIAQQVKKGLTTSIDMEPIDFEYEELTWKLYDELDTNQRTNAALLGIADLADLYQYYPETRKPTVQ